MTREEIYDRLQKKYTDAVGRMNERPWDSRATTDRRCALNDMLVFVRSFAEKSPLYKDGMVL